MTSWSYPSFLRDRQHRRHVRALTGNNQQWAAVSCASGPDLDGLAPVRDQVRKRLLHRKSLQDSSARDRPLQLLPQSRRNSDLVLVRHWGMLTRASLTEHPIPARPNGRQKSMSVTPSAASSSRGTRLLLLDPRPHVRRDPAPVTSRMRVVVLAQEGLAKTGSWCASRCSARAAASSGSWACHGGSGACGGGTRAERRPPERLLVVGLGAGSFGCGLKRASRPGMGHG